MILLLIFFTIFCINLATAQNVYLDVEDSGKNVTVDVVLSGGNNISSFLVELSYANLKVVKVEKGRDLNWQFFFYKVFENKTRIVATRYKEEPINGGILATIHFEKTGEPISIDIGGKLSDVNAKEIKATWMGYSEKMRIISFPYLVYAIPIVVLSIIAIIFIRDRI